MKTLVKNTKKATKETKLVNGQNGMEVKTLKPKKEKAPVYLKEGLTGKQVTSNKIATNNAHKLDSGSISYCIKRLIEFNQGFLESFNGYKLEDLTPKNLLQFKKETEAKKGRFSVWLVMQLVTRYYKNI
jgi:hypothetical protein